MTAKTFLYFICSNEYVYDNFSYEEFYGTRNVSSCIMYVDQNQYEYYRLVSRCESPNEETFHFLHYSHHRGKTLRSWYWIAGFHCAIGKVCTRTMRQPRGAFSQRWVRTLCKSTRSSSEWHIRSFCHRFIGSFSVIMIWSIPCNVVSAKEKIFKILMNILVS